MLKIDTGDTAQVQVKSAAVDDTQNIRFTSFARADRAKRQVLEQIDAIDDPQAVESYLRDESLILDALHLFDPAMSAEIEEHASDHTAMLRAGAGSLARSSGAPVTAQSQTSQTKGKIMFAIDTGDTGGSLGPWLSWTSNGSAMKGFQPMKWILRGKDDAGNKTEEMVPAFENGCVMDLDTLKLGWKKDGAQGQAPERRWNPSISQSTPRPDDSKKQSGAYAWSRALTVRLAIGNGQTATWEQGSFAAYRAFEKLAGQIQAQYPGDNTLPLIKQTGVEQMKLSNGSANIPILEVVKWVPRPDCLKADAPAIDTGAAAEQPAQAPVAQPAPTPQPAATQEPATTDSEYGF